MELAKKIEGSRQTGAEFLTWLIYRCVSSDGMVQTSLGPVEMWPETRVTLVSPYAGGEVNIVKGDAPAQGREVAAALLKGKHIEDAKMSVNFGGKRWDFTFNGPSFALGGIKVPAVLGDTEMEIVLDRFELLGTLEEIMGSLYDGFLEIRMNPERWSDEVRSFEDWLTHLAQEAP